MEEELKKLAAMEAEVAEAEKQIEAAREEIALKYSPVKVGDVVVVTGYSHRERKIRVETVVFRRKWQRNEFYARGPIIKKDGASGINWGEWSQAVE